MSGHVVPAKVYVAICTTLLVLTALTVWVASVDLGAFNPIVAITIAVSKALLVILYFMHVRYSSGLTWVVVSGGFFWLVVMIALTMSDVSSRGWLGLPGG